MSDIIARALGNQSLDAVNTDALSRFIVKVMSGQNVKISFVGDSITEGNTVTTPGVDDYASIVCATLSNQFGVTVSKANRAVSGRTVLSSQVKGDFSTALADQADCYVISFANNDMMSDKQSPGYGYPLAASISGLEYMIRRIRKEMPQADIVLMSEPPNSVGSANNQYLIAYSNKMKFLASVYGCYFADGYTAFERLGNWNSHLSDGVHPNSAGHAVLAKEVLKGFQRAKKFTFGLSPAIPELPVYGKSYDIKNWQQYASAGRAAGANGWKFFSSAEWTGTNPYVSSTVGARIQGTFLGSECAFQLDCGSGTGAVSIEIDGVMTHSNVDLTAYGSGARYIPITGLSYGLHHFRIVILSGTITWRGFWALHDTSEFIGVDSPRATFTSYGATASNSDLYNGTYKGTTTFNSTVTFDFIGTGIMMECIRKPSGGRITPTVDGVNYPEVDTSNGGSVSNYGGILLVSGLPYGRHSVSLKLTTTSGDFNIGGVVVFNEKASRTPRVQRGIAMSGEIIKLPIPFNGRPLIKVSGNGVYATSESATGFTMSGTASELGVWEAEGELLIY